MSDASEASTTDLPARSTKTPASLSNSLPPNAHRLLAYLTQRGPTHRADLARALDVSRTTITNLTNPLFEAGLLVELDKGASQLKRPLGLSSTYGYLASVAFFVDTCVLMLATLDGREITTRTVALREPMLPNHRLSTAVSLLRWSIGNVGLAPSALRGIHLALDTQVNTETGEIDAPVASVRWYGVNPRDHFADEFAVPILLENSVRLSGLAEALWGAGAQHSDVFYLSIAMGATSSHVRGGVIASGTHGGAGEFGHVVYQWDGPACACGNRGCTMQYVTIPALLRDYHARTGKEITWNTFMVQAAAADAVVVEIVEAAAIVCARTLINVAHILDPEIVVISQTGIGIVPHFIDTVRHYVQEHALPLVGRHLQVVESALPDLPQETARAGITRLRDADCVRALGFGRSYS